MDPLLLRLYGMTVWAKFFRRHEELIRAPLVASLAQTGGIRTMFGTTFFYLSRSVGTSLFSFGLRDGLVRVRHPVKEKTENPVPCPGFTCA